MVTGQSRLYGGNQVTTIAPEAKGVFQVAEGRYIYTWVTLDPGTSHRVEGLASCTVLCKTGAWGRLALEDEGVVLAEGDSAQVEKRALTLSAAGEPVTCVIAGTEVAHANGPSLVVTRAGRHYRVAKPWGHELWLNGEHPGYCLKEILLTAGNRTSLQYHERKEETIVLFSGRVRLGFEAKARDENDVVLPVHLGQAAISAVSVIHVAPRVLHRLEAVTDVLLYEASTPHLDDVIRVQDDTARHDGRILSEHRE